MVYFSKRNNAVFSWLYLQPKQSTKMYVFTAIAASLDLALPQT